VKDFARLKERVVLTAAKTSELQEQLRLSAIVTHVEIAQEQKARYFQDAPGLRYSGRVPVHLGRYRLPSH
jgi:hypothetical protein